MHAKTVLSLILTALMFATTSVQAYEVEPTKQDLKDFYKVLKVAYTDMPTVMNGLEILIDSDFDLKNVEDKSVICNFVQAAERISFIASNAQVHPKFRDTLEGLRTIVKPETAKIIKDSLRRHSYPCL